MMSHFTRDIGFPLTPPAGRSPLCCALNRTQFAELVSHNLWSHSCYLYLFAFPVPFSGTLNQNWTNTVHCQVQANFFSFLELNSIQCYSWGGGFSLSQISGIHQRFLLHLISYLGAPGVANEDNVQYCKKNWLHLAYQDQHTERVAVIEIIITAQFHWRAVEAFFSGTTQGYDQLDVNILYISRMHIHMQPVPCCFQSW